MFTSPETNGRLAHPARRALVALFAVVVGSLLAAFVAAPAAHADSGDRPGVAAPAVAASAFRRAATLTPPAAAGAPKPLGLSCERQVLRRIGLGVTQVSIRCSGNSSSPYWAEGWCAGAGYVKGVTHFPPFLLPVPGPWSTAACPNGDHFTSYDTHP
jgi:hypothetical protein